MTVFPHALISDQMMTVLKLEVLIVNVSQSKVEYQRMMQLLLSCPMKLRVFKLFVCLGVFVSVTQHLCWNFSNFVNSWLFWFFEKWLISSLECCLPVAQVLSLVFLVSSMFSKSHLYVCLVFFFCKVHQFESFLVSPLESWPILRLMGGHNDILCPWCGWCNHE